MDMRKGRFERLFGTSIVPMAVLDSQGFVVSTNESFDLLFSSLAGRRAAEIREPLVEFLRERDAYRFAYHFSRLITESVRSATMESPFRAFDGSVKTISIRAWTIPEDNDAPPSDQGPFVAFSIEDLTAEKKRERGLLEAKESAEKATETKSQFLANMSHEIRTPIQTIIGTAELMQDTKLDREQQEYVRQVRFSADVLLSLINDILDYSKIEAGRLELEHIDFDVEKTVEQAVDLVCMEAHKKGLEVVVDQAADAPRLIRGDPGRLRQVIVNLVKNAVKFTKEGSIVISARRSSTERGDALQVSVADTGVGVSPEVRPKLFTTFFQGDASTTRRFGGTGLGLAISRTLIEQMGGSIGMRPAEKRGSVFYFTIPIEQSAFAPPRESLPVNEDDRVLVVDDSHEARKVAVSYLGEFGYAHVEEAESGEEALRKLDAAAGAGRPFTICLIDMQMPNMDGWRLAAEINNNRAVNEARLILMVPQGTLGAEAKMTLLQWFNAYLNKPLKRRDLAEALGSAVAAPIDLEAAGGATAEAPLPGTERTVVESSSVLVVEDHEVNQQLFAVILEKLGHQVSIADDGQAAVETVTRTGIAAFDLVFMDIQMPRLNGYEAAKQIRELGYAKPIIAVTASALADERQRCMAAGMDDVLVKPFKRTDIEAALASWLGKKRREVSAPGCDDEEEFGELEEIDEEETSGSPCSDTEVFDPVALSDTFMGKTDVVRSLLERYLARTDEQVASLDALLEGGDWEKLRREVHTIKGSALNLSAKRLGMAAAEAEQAAIAHDATLSAERIEMTRRAYRIFRDVAAAYLAESPGGTSAGSAGAKTE